MKPIACCLFVWLALAVAVAPMPAQDLNLGPIHVPRAFVHGEQTYAAGTYQLVLTDKDGQPWFRVQDAEGNPLFEEMGVVRPRKGGKMRRAFRLRGEMLRGYEYYRVRVIQPDRLVLAFFLIKPRA